MLDGYSFPASCPPPVFEPKNPFADKSPEREGWSPTSTKKLGWASFTDPLTFLSKVPTIKSKVRILPPRGYAHKGDEDAEPRRGDFRPNGRRRAFMKITPLDIQQE